MAIDAGQILNILLQSGLQERARTQSFEDRLALQRSGSNQSLFRALALASSKGPGDPDTSGLGDILKIIGSSSKIQQDLLTERPELVRLAGTKNMSKTDEDAIGEGRKELALRLGPNISELFALQEFFTDLGLGPQASFAGRGAELLGTADPTNPISQLFSRGADIARGASGGAAPGTPGASLEAPEQAGTLSFTGGPGGTSGAFQGTTEDEHSLSKTGWRYSVPEATSLFSGL